MRSTIALLLVAYAAAAKTQQPDGSTDNAVSVNDAMPEEIVAEIAAVEEVAEEAVVEDVVESFVNGQDGYWFNAEDDEHVLDENWWLEGENSVAEVDHLDWF